MSAAEPVQQPGPGGWGDAARLSAKGDLGVVIADADTGAATRSIGDVTLIVAETSEHTTTASITVDLTGMRVQGAAVYTRPCFVDG